jgi:hypothetical protein
VRQLRWALLGIAAATLVAGCNNDCYNLAKQICQCQPSAQAIATCNSNISQANSVAQPTSADLSRCTAALPVCDCRTLATGTPEAKVACLMARPNPKDSAFNP